MPGVRLRWPLVVLPWLCACGGGSPPSPSSPSSPPATDAPPANASTAVAMNSFEGSEEPAVLYYPASASFTNDSYVNMTNPSSELFRFVLRYRYKSEGWWD